MPNDDIRAWGRSNGFEVGDEGRLPPGLRASYDKRVQDNAETPVDGDAEEIAPVIAKPSTADRMRSLSSRVKSTPKARMRTGAKAKPRVSVEKIIGMGWELLGSLANNFNPAVSRVLYMQAPVAGMVLEDKVKNTVADKFLQPIARAADGGNVAMALIGPPLLVQALTMRPERAPQIIPMLRASLRMWVALAGEKLEKQIEEDQEFEKKYGSKIDEMMEYLVGPIFTPPPTFVPSEPE